jgi:hypothetical protein
MHPVFDKSPTVPRRNPLRASRIFVLASQSTLSDLQRPARDFEHQRDRAGRFIINALECLLLAQTERAASARMCEQARKEHAPAVASLPSVGFRFGQTSTPPDGNSELVLAINTLTDALDTLREGNEVQLAKYIQVLGHVAQNLSAQESN